MGLRLPIAGIKVDSVCALKSRGSASTYITCRPRYKKRLSPTLKADIR